MTEYETKIEDLVEIEVREIPHSSIKLTGKTWYWCQLPYKNRKNGCPNFGKPPCPVKSREVWKEEYLKPARIRVDNSCFLYIVFARFDLRAQIERIQSKHPDYPDSKARNILWWQGAVKRLCKEKIREIYRKNPSKDMYLYSSGSGLIDSSFDQVRVHSMEAVGFDVMHLYKEECIDFEVKPKDTVVLCNLILSANQRLEI